MKIREEKLAYVEGVAAGEAQCANQADALIFCAGETVSDHNCSSDCAIEPSFEDIGHAGQPDRWFWESDRPHGRSKVVACGDAEDNIIQFARLKCSVFHCRGNRKEMETKTVSSFRLPPENFYASPTGMFVPVYQRQIWENKNK